DDVAGLLAAREFRALAVKGVEVEEHTGDVAALAESLAMHDEVVIVDAAAGGAPAGTVLAFIPGVALDRARSSSHGLGVAEALALAQALGAAPRVRLIGIAGTEFGLGAQPSTAVLVAARAVAQRVAEELTEKPACA
ncbi:MAG TPA: hydrogenase maturation protease, partial [Candidatus Sulfotelmatobacter sp.]|nr:hydrogenase maturation protease [Candidatus Sulfotelmatobacter sp.]